MKHFEHCSCERCRGERPPCPAPQPGGFLMQQIVAGGRAFLRYERFTLCLEGIPADACMPLRLTAVCAQEECIRYERCDSSCCGITLHTHIPLLCTLCDQRGCSYTAHAEIEVPLQLRLCGSERELDRSRIWVSAVVRLARTCACIEGCRADVCLDACVEAWAVTCRPMYTSGCAPQCPPPLPLYPQPCRIRCE